MLLISVATAAADEVVAEAGEAEAEPPMKKSRSGTRAPTVAKAKLTAAADPKTAKKGTAAATSKGEERVHVWGRCSDQISSELCRQLWVDGSGFRAPDEGIDSTWYLISCLRCPALRCNSTPDLWGPWGLCFEPN